MEICCARCCRLDVPTSRAVLLIRDPTFGDRHACYTKEYVSMTIKLLEFSELVQGL